MQAEVRPCTHPYRHTHRCPGTAMHFNTHSNTQRTHALSYQQLMSATTRLDTDHKLSTAVARSSNGMPSPHAQTVLVHVGRWRTRCALAHCHVSYPCPLFARNGVSLSKWVHIHFLLGSPASIVITTMWSSWLWYLDTSSSILISGPDITLTL